MQSVERAVLLLRALADAVPAKPTLAELSQSTGLNRATAWRLLMTLAEQDLVEHSADGHYGIGAGLADLAHPFPSEAILTAAPTVLGRVAAQTGETAGLAVYRRGALVYVEEAMPPAALAVSWKGRAVALHATSTGKVILAFDGGRASCPDPLPRFTETTITDRSVLDAELAEARRVGYTTCRGEFEEAVLGVSAPVFDRFDTLRAVLSIWGPARRLSPARFPDLGQRCIEAARELSAISRPNAAPAPGPAGPDAPSAPA